MNNAKLLLLLAAVAAAPFARARSLGTGVEAFNRTCRPGATVPAVFSPVSFELDCVLFAEAGDTIVRAGIAESIGVLTEFDQTFRPVLRHFAETAPTNGFRFVSARAFCLSDIRRASRVYRNRIWDLYGAGVCRRNPPAGAEAFLRAKMDGDMERFSVTDSQASSSRQLFFDLVSVAVAPRDVFPSATVASRPFAGGATRVPMMTGTVRHGRHRNKLYTLVRLPLKDGASFYAVLPNEGHTLDEVRARFNPVRFEEMLLEPEMLGLPDTGTFLSKVTLPVVDMVAENDLNPALAAFKVPVNGLARLGPDTPGGRVARQRVRFRLGPNDVPPAAPKGNSADDARYEALPPTAGEIVFDRPFLWFVHHPATATLPVMGVYAGE